jgi:NAD(P)-dependent dehydrogenase (short-subunit alcohol dehydrogenase family)
MTREIIIIGAASGIGQETAMAYAEKECRLYLGDMNAEGLEHTKNQLVSMGCDVSINTIDTSDQTQIKAFMQKAFENLEHLSTLIYTAGVGRFCPLVEVSPEQWEREISVNLSGAFFCAQAAANRLIEQKSGGNLLFVSSIGAIRNTNQVAPYCAAKAGLNMLVKCLASELGNHRIRANAVMPGVTETNMTKPMLDLTKYRNMLKTTIPLGKWVQAKDVASLLLYLDSDEAHFINGQSIAVCGGHSIRPDIDWWPLDYAKDYEGDWHSAFKQYPFVKKDKR